MSLPVVFTADASDDVEQAWSYFESQRSGLGNQFIARLDEVVGQIGRSPALYAQYYRDTRCARLRRFPYIVIYRELPHAVEVVAVAHGSRNPSYLRRRGS